METMTRVLIADADADFRRLFAEILNHEKRTECVGGTGGAAGDFCFCCFIAIRG